MRGFPIRISYYEDENFQAHILRLEIRADSVPSAAERSVYAKTEEQKWQRTTADDPRDQAMTLGSLMASFAWTLWWNFDWQRFIKFYGISAPPYRRSIVVVVRGFFPLCSLGAGRELLRQLLERSQSAQFYRSAFLTAAVWFIVIVIMVKAVEWLSKRRKKVPVSQ